MRTMNKDEFKLIKSIFGCTQTMLKKAMADYLVEIYGRENVVIEKEYILAFGDIPVGLVAHMDTVHKSPVRDLYYDKEENIMWSPQGIGADDRAGIYAIMELIAREYKPTIILTTDEEIGAIGASCVIGDYPNAPCKLNFLIELDRRGEKDSVFYDCDNRLFEDYINYYGFITEWGSFSDISYIAPAWGVAAVNLSIGYYNEHSLAEYLNIHHMFATIDKVGLILENVCSDDFFEYIEMAKSESWKKMLGGVNFTTPINDGICWGCLDVFNQEMLIESDGETYCGDCYAKMFSTCTTCQTSFFNPDLTNIECENCRKY